MLVSLAQNCNFYPSLRTSEASVAIHKSFFWIATILRKTQNLAMTNQSQILRLCYLSQNLIFFRTRFCVFLRNFAEST
ncbi:hypothetical protein [Helicobacter sp. 23-1045]